MGNTVLCTWLMIQKEKELCHYVYVVVTTWYVPAPGRHSLYDRYTDGDIQCLTLECLNEPTF
jgi:hypothetical protein